MFTFLFVFSLLDVVLLVFFLLEGDKFVDSGFEEESCAVLVDFLHVVDLVLGELVVVLGRMNE